MNEEELLKERERYYSFRPVQFEIIKCLKHRELAFLSPKGDKRKMIRYLMAFNIDYLTQHFKVLRFFKDNLNMYHSVSVLKNIPLFTWDLKKRRNDEKYKKFNDEYINHVIGYNVFFDFDIKKNFEIGMNEVFEFKKLLDDFKVPYYVLNSSEKGIHFHVPYEYMPQFPINDLVERIRTIIYNIKGIYDFETLDDSIIDLKRICKVPYSCVNEFVCLPLNDKQLEQYKINRDFLKIKNVLINIVIKNRGLLIRSHGISEEKLKENVLNFFEEYK